MFCLHLTVTIQYIIVHFHGVTFCEAVSWSRLSPFLRQLNPIRQLQKVTCQASVSECVQAQGGQVVAYRPSSVSECVQAQRGQVVAYRPSSVEGA